MSQKTEEEIKDDMLKKQQEIQEKYDKLYEEMDKGDYFNQTYKEGSVVQIPGELFSSMVNYVSAHARTLHSFQNTYQVLMNAALAMQGSTDNITLKLMEQHKTNVDLGITISSEEMDKLDAEKKINEVKIETASKKKGKKIVKK